MQKIINKFNEIFDWIYERVDKVKKKEHKPLSDNLYYNVFKPGGAGLYQVCFYATNNFISKIIVNVSNFMRRVFKGDKKKYNFSHCEFALFAPEGPQKFLTSYNGINLGFKLEEFYESFNLDEIKVFTLASCEGNGMVYSDFSRHNNRKMAIRKLEGTPEQHKYIADLLTNKIYSDQPYDFWGVKSQPFISYFVKFFKKIKLSFIANLLIKIGDSKNHHFCSEQQLEIPLQLNIKTCDIENPSPPDIYAYKKDWTEVNK